MPANNRKLLVTTALECTWGKVENILFLGEWCKLYERRHIWAKRNHETARFHWDDRNKLKRDYDYLESLHHSLLKCLAASLNEFHHVNFPIRYWQILLDPWLMAYVGVVFDRWECLRIAFEQNDRLEIIACGNPILTDAPFSYTEFIKQAISDEWNNDLYQRIIQFKYSGKCLIRIKEASGVSQAKGQQEAVSRKQKSLPKRLALAVDLFLGNSFSKRDVVFLTPYFNFFSLIRLNLAMGQVPRLFHSQFKSVESLNDLLPSSGSSPDRVGMHFNFQHKSAFEEFINQSIIHDIPQCLVEGYPALRDRANNLTIKTKAIVTANNHWGDAFAKAWFAEQVNNGTKLVIMEHGGSFPAYKELFDFEEDISDVKATWFLPYHSKHVRVPPSKLVNRFAKYNPLLKRLFSHNYCSVISNEYPRWVYRATFYPMAAQCLTSLDLIARFYKSLNEDIKKCLRIKLTPIPDQPGWNVSEIYSDALGADKILSEGKIGRIFHMSKVIVCTYPETTFSEAMASGIPTVMLYPDHLYERHLVALPLLDILRSANVIFHDSQAAAAHLNAIWADPDCWWNSPEVLHARAEFRRQATDLDSDWLKEWMAFLKGVIA